MENCLRTMPDRDQELLFLRSKVIDLEHRSRCDNVLFFGFPEKVEGSDTKSFLQTTLPKITGLNFDPPLEMQRAHRIGPLQAGEGKNVRPRTLIVCFLRHEQARQLINDARIHGSYTFEGHEIRVAAEFSKETNDRRKAFLSFRSRLRQLDIKYGLFEPARLRIAKDGISKGFFNPDDLQQFLENSTPQNMDCAVSWPNSQSQSSSFNSRMPTGGTRCNTGRSNSRGRDPSRPVRSVGDRSYNSQAMAITTQDKDRDKSRSPLKTFSSIEDAIS